LRDLPETFPYMHDGSVETLAEVIKFYNRGGEKNKWLDPQMHPLNLDSAEQAELVAFLDALNGGEDRMSAPKNLPR
ncbi:MAG TPA: cytochrome-c peroxidase, partial [Elusimicrobiota bacterium]|nr:cytochrome-c peroxidase [Elusimicrobiota bacterium]